mmetsp:Transcript_203/g.639  ORF Transcript_203/g.639 Transcript_203/m.639 type:complete len:263 (-) Transcript_203:148-936(-)
MLASLLASAVSAHPRRCGAAPADHSPVPRREGAASPADARRRRRGRRHRRPRQGHLSERLALRGPRRPLPLHARPARRHCTWVAEPGGRRRNLPDGRWRRRRRHCRAAVWLCQVALLAVEERRGQRRVCGERLQRVARTHQPLPRLRLHRSHRGRGRARRPPDLAPLGGRRAAARRAGRRQRLCPRGGVGPLRVAPERRVRSRKAPLDRGPRGRRVLAIGAWRCTHAATGLYCAFGARGRHSLQPLCPRIKALLRERGRREL